MDAGSAEALLRRAEAESNRLKRHLLVAGALRELLASDPVVVGGTAEEYWTADEYHQTDLDVCAPLDEEAVSQLRAAGFKLDGRHWVREGLQVAVEFPESRIAGELARTVLVPLGGGATARLIGVDDLYLDRLRQATMQEDHEGTEFNSALAVAAACFEQIDWIYIRDQISEDSGVVGESMRRIDSRIRSRVRRTVDE